MSVKSSFNCSICGHLPVHDDPDENQDRGADSIIVGQQPLGVNCGMGEENDGYHSHHVHKLLNDPRLLPVLQ